MKYIVTCWSWKGLRCLKSIFSFPTLFQYYWWFHCARRKCIRVILMRDSNSIDASSGWYLGNVQLKNQYKASGIRSIECPHSLYRNLRQVNCVKAHITTSPSYKKNTTLQQFHLFVRISPFLYLLSTTITNIHSWRPTTQIKLSEYKTVPDPTSAWKMN